MGTFCLPHSSLAKHTKKIGHGRTRMNTDEIHLILLYNKKTFRVFRVFRGHFLY